MKVDFSKTFTITNNMLDASDNVRASSILDIAQETAATHADLLKVGFNEFINRNLIWVVFRTKIEFIKNIKNIKSLRCDTQLVKPRLFEFPRDYEFYYNNELVAQARSTWAIYSLEENKIVVPNDIDALYIDDLGLYSRLKKLSVINKDKLLFCKDITVTYSMLDHNGHMNNTRYVDLFLDVYRPNKDQIIKEIQVEYISQCYLDDVISLYICKENDNHYLYGYKGDELKFYMEVKYF